MFEAIDRCRICGNPELIRILDLGEQSLTGVFPRNPDEPVTRGPLQLVKCHPAASSQSATKPCGLVQLAHSYSAGEMYGENYGYRSSLNRSMVEHLRTKPPFLQKLAPPEPGDLILDIGSNDGTTLSFYPAEGLQLVGIDPTSAKFAQYYKPHIRRIADFFTGELFEREFPGRRAKIVTSIAMFYDLPRPQVFVNDVARVLADDGVWHFEQSYLPTMLDALAYDTVCHEHLEYYGLAQVKYLLDHAGLKIVDLQLNDVNGGSFAVTAAKVGSRLPEASARVAELLQDEERRGLAGLETYRQFATDVAKHRDELRDLLRKLKKEGREILGYGASTKGNVVLQYCGVTKEEIPCIAEVNPDKFGCHTPGTLIPIVSEAAARERKPDYFLVLPWHFKDHIVAREQAYLQAGGKLLFPLPKLQVIG